MEKKIVIAGGTGFIGSFLKKEFMAAGYKVLIISRDTKHINWDTESKIIEALEGAELLINLAGKSVDCRYNAKNRKLIINSRLQTTERLQMALEKCSTPPPLWINSSTATIYRHAEDRAMDEEKGEIGQGFSVEVAKAWEKSFFQKPLTHTRKVALRIAIVLGPGGGVIKPFSNLVKFGLGGHQGNGRQMFSWLHIEDLYRIILFIMEHKQIEGVYNAAAPNPLPNKDFMKALRKIFKPLFYLPSPKFLLKAGAWFINTEPELILKSRWVIPTRLLSEDFQFKYREVKGALENILKKKA